MREAVGGPPYFGNYGTMSLDSLVRQEKYGQSLRLAPKWVDPASMLDEGPLKEARTNLGMK
jgi:hypothetical protein